MPTDLPPIQLTPAPLPGEGFNLPRPALSRTFLTTSVVVVTLLVASVITFGVLAALAWGA